MVYMRVKRRFLFGHFVMIYVVCVFNVFVKPSC